jgi:hypothetical protein
MINIFKKSLSKERKVEILTEAYLEIYRYGLSEFSNKRIKRRSSHKPRGGSKLDKNELFSFNFIFFARAYLDTSKDKEREKIMGAVIDGFLWGLSLPNGLDERIIAINLSNFYQERFFSVLGEYQRHPSIDSPLLHLITQRVFRSKYRSIISVNKVQLNRSIKNILRSCKFCIHYNNPMLEH